MKSIKGFTLTELLAVIAIIGILSLIAIPSVSNVLKTVKEDDLQQKHNEILLAAKLYMQDSDESVNEVSLCTLILANYINEDKADNCGCSESDDSICLWKTSTELYSKDAKVKKDDISGNYEISETN